MAITAAQLMVKVGADTKGAEQGLGNIAGMLGPGGAIVAAGAAAAATVAGVAIASTRMAGDFQAGMTSLVTGAGESQNNLKLVSDGVLNLATQTGTTTQQLTDGMYMIESAGYHGKAGLDVLKAAAEGAKVGQADLGVVADGTTTLMTDFGAASGGASGAVNALIATVASGKTHMQDLAGSLSQVAPTASAAKVSMSDMLGAMATMTGEGVPAANAATYLRQTILALDAPSKQAKDALKSVGLSSEEVSQTMQRSLPDALKMITDAVGKKFPVGSAQYVEALKNISGGSKTMQGMLDLTGDHLATFQQNVATVSGSVAKGGNSINGWSQVQGTFNQQMDRSREVVETLSIQLGTHLLPAATQLAGAFADHLPGAVDATIAGVKNLVQTGQNLIHFFQDTGPASTAVKGALIAVTGAALGLAASGIPALVAGLATSIPLWIAEASTAAAAAVATIAAAAPFLLVGAAVALVVAGIILLVTHWPQVQAFFGNIAHAIGDFLGGAGRAIGQFFSGLGTGIHNALSGAGQAIGGFFSGIGTAIHNQLAQWGQMFQVGVAAIQAIVQAGFNLALAIITAPIHAVVNLFNWLFNHNYYFHDLVVTIQREFTVAQAMIGAIWNAITGFLSNTWTTIQRDVQLAFAFVRSIIQTEITTAQNVLTAVVSAITGFLAGAWATIQNAASGAWKLVEQYIIQPVQRAIGLVEERINWVRNVIQATFAAVVVIVEAAWNRFTGTISSAIGTVQNDINTIVNAILSPVNDLGSKLFDAGKNLMQMLVNGIKNMAGAVGDAAKAVASNITSFLGFHSPTEKGPGADADRWMPALGAMLASGLDAQSEKVKRSAQGIAAAMVGGITGNPGGVPASGATGGGGIFGGVSGGAISGLPAGLPSGGYAAGAAGGGAGQDITIVVQLKADGRTLAQTVVPHIHSVVRAATGARSF